MVLLKRLLSYGREWILRVLMRGKFTISSLTSIVAIDLRGAIGCDNTLPWRLKTDMAFFRQNTVGNTVIMGRKTYESIGNKPLPRRNNIVLSHNTVLFPSTPTCLLVPSVEEALFTAAKLNDDEAFVIGGAQTYRQFDDLVDRYLITVVDHEVPDADAFLSANVLESLTTWNRTEVGKHPKTEGQDEFAFSIFEVTAPDLEKRKAERDDLIASYSSKITTRKRPRSSKKSTNDAPQDTFAFYAA